MEKKRLNTNTIKVDIWNYNNAAEIIISYVFNNSRGITKKITKDFLVENYGYSPLIQKVSLVPTPTIDEIEAGAYKFVKEKIEKLTNNKNNLHNANNLQIVLNNHLANAVNDFGQTFVARTIN